MAAFGRQVKSFLRPVDTISSICLLSSGASGTFTLSAASNKTMHQLTVVSENGTVVVETENDASSDTTLFEEAGHYINLLINDRSVESRYTKYCPDFFFPVDLSRNKQFYYPTFLALLLLQIWLRYMSLTCNDPPRHGMPS